MNKERIGFDPKKEKDYLMGARDKRGSLQVEIETQLGEDFGVVEFTQRYDFIDGKIIDKVSGKSLVEIIANGGVSEEIESWKMREKGLKENSQKTWIHFSPKNEKLGYNTNSVDFLKLGENGEVVWNRMVVRNGFKEMNNTRSFLSGEKTVKDEMEIMKSPISVDLKLTEIFDFFQLSEVKNSLDFETIKNMVKSYMEIYKNDFGKDLIEDDNLIFRLYSTCFKALKKRIDGEVLSRGELRGIMYGKMKDMVTQSSYGCAATTIVGEFGEKIGYYINADGQVKYGEIPDGFKECKQCGCWYKGEKCPFC